MCLYLSSPEQSISVYPSYYVIHGHPKCNILHSSCQNVLSSAYLNKLFKYRMQQLKVQFSIPCLVKDFAQMRSEVAHGPAVAMKIKNIESATAPKRT